MEMDLPIPIELVQACNRRSMQGDYLLSDPEDWLQPCGFERTDFDAFNRDFDGSTSTKEGILVGAIRICNTGCEGYHLFVFKGPFAGQIWSDQRIPDGRVTKLTDSLSEYLEVIRTKGRSHVEHWDKVR